MSPTWFPVPKWLNAYRHSVVVRLVVFGIAIVVVAMVLRVIVLLPYLRDGVATLASSHQLAIAEYVARDIDDKIKARIDFLDRLARHLPEDILNDRGRLESWLRERHETFPAFSSGFMVVPLNGRGILADYPVVAGRRDLNFGGDDWFVEATSERRVALGKPVRERTAGEPIIVMAAPVLNSQGQVIAVLAGVSALVYSGFFDTLQKTQIGETGGFLLISPRDDVFVAATDPAKVLRPLPPPGVNPLHDRAMAGYRGTGITVNLAGIEELSAMVSVPTTGWFLVARVPTSEVFQVVEQARTFILRNALGLGGLVVFGLTVVLPRFLSPLTTASRLIHRMATGEIELQPLKVVHRDEIGELVEGFNFLLARVNEVTEERVAEKARMAASLRQWMADTSHELRTPIAVLRAQIEAIQDGIHAADTSTLAVLHREVMGLSRLVDDLYTLARSDVGQLECRLGPTDPSALLDELIAAYGDRFASAGLELEWIAATAQPLVSGDPARLRQVFANLLENTLRYGNVGNRLRITAEILPDALALYFDDSGPGVPDASLPHLFDRFYRVDASRSRERGGSGIGLAVCRSTIEAHGGLISASPSPLGGLRIAIMLPRLKEGS